MSDDWFEKHLRLIRQLLEPQRRLQEQMDKWLEPQRRLQEQLLEPQRRLQEQMNKWFEPQRRLQEQLLEPQRRLQEQMNKWFEPQRQFQENLDNCQQLLELENYITNILSKTKHENISVNQKSSMISVEGDIVSVNEFSDICNELSESIKNLPSPVQVLNVIWTCLQKIKKPIATLLLIFILPFIINITSNLSTPYFENIISELENKPKREKIKAIRLEAQRDFPPDVLKDYRFVSATVLRVRKGPSTKNQVIDEIYFGQLARLIKKGRKWSSIEYTDEDTEQKVTGWVFNRYLAKFKK